MASLGSSWHSVKFSFQTNNKYLFPSYYHLSYPFWIKASLSVFQDFHVLTSIIALITLSGSCWFSPVFSLLYYNCWRAVFCSSPSAFYRHCLAQGLTYNRYSVIVKIMTGTSLAVQWLRLCASNAGGTGSIPGQGTKIPHAAAWPKD